MTLSTLSSINNMSEQTSIITGVIPTNIPGCILWLDATDSTTITANASNTVSQWADKSGYGYNFTNYAGTVKTKTTKYLNLNVLDFSNNGVLSNSNLFFYKNNYHIFTVAYLSTDTNKASSTTTNTLIYNIPSNYFNLNIYNLTGYFAYIGNGSGYLYSASSGIGTSPYTTPQIIEVTNTAGQIQTFANGIGGTVSSVNASNTWNGVYIGGQANTNQWRGYIGEILIYDNVLSVGTRQLIEGYLSAKWGLTTKLPMNHPYQLTLPNLNINLYNNPKWWYKYLINDISYTLSTSTSISTSVYKVYNYATTSYDGNIYGWNIYGPRFGLSTDNTTNLGLTNESIRFGSGITYGIVNSNTQWIKWPSINTVSSYYTLSYIIKYADTTAPSRNQQQWNLSDLTNAGLSVYNYTSTGTSLVWNNNNTNCIFNMNNVLDNSPHHFTFIFGPSTFQPQIYLDASALMVPSNLSAPYNTITSNLSGFNFSNTGDTHINAWLGETRLYNYAMIPQQVNSLYNIMMCYNTNTTAPITITNITGGSYQKGYATTNGIKYLVYAFTDKNTACNVQYNCTQSTQCFVLAVGGGGGGGFTNFSTNFTGGGGGGGVVMIPVTLSTGTGNIKIEIGRGGYDNSIYSTGSPSAVTFTGATVQTINVIGGGGGGNGDNFYSYSAGEDGGSGGGSGVNNLNSTYTGGSALYTGYNNGNYGADGFVGTNNNFSTGGGGGAGTPGLIKNNTPSGVYGGGDGGNGIRCFLPGIKDFIIKSTITGNKYLVSDLYWGAGGGGNSYNTNSSSYVGNGGLGGGGGGANNITGIFGAGGGSALNTGNPGTTTIGGDAGENTGSGGGGNVDSTLLSAGMGGSGIVIIAFPVYNPVTAKTTSVLTQSALTNTAYNSICAAYSCKLINYNYYGPILTLRYSTDSNGLNLQNFYADTYGNMGTEYLGTGTSLSSWLITAGASINYAYVTKWYDQGMDFSFNCAIQKNNDQQPIYDVSHRLINFGYQGAEGGVAAPTMNCYLNLPDYTFPILDTSYTIIIKNYNITKSGTSYFYASGSVANNKTNNLYYDYNSSTYSQNWTSNKYDISNTIITNAIITTKYSAGSTGTRYFYINNNIYSGGTKVARSQSYSNNAIGYYYNGSQFGNHQMYYMYIFSTALSDADRNLIENVNYYNSIDTIISNIGLAMYYPMNINDTSFNYLANWASGSPVYDISLVNSPSFIVNSRTGSSALSFVAINSQYAILPSFTPTTNGITFAFWINSNASAADSIVFDLGTTAGQLYYDFLMKMNTGGTNYFGFYIYDNNNTIITSFTIPRNFNVGNWVHLTLTMTYSSSNTSTWSIYVNGYFLTRKNNAYYPNTTITLNKNYFARSNKDSDPYYNGYLDDFRIYNRILYLSEIQQLYYSQGWNFIPSSINIYYGTASFTGYQTKITNGIYTLFVYTTTSLVTNAITINNALNMQFQVFVVGGGGNGGVGYGGGGGGGGGVVQSVFYFTGSDIINIQVAPQSLQYSNFDKAGYNGYDSSFNFTTNKYYNIIAKGGGGGGNRGNASPAIAGTPGGCGGGGSGGQNGGSIVSSIYTSGSVVSGYRGGNSSGPSYNAGAGGGGAGMEGVDNNSNMLGTNGGDGMLINTSYLFAFTNTIYANYYWGGGGGGGTANINGVSGNGGKGGGGGGGQNRTTPLQYGFGGTGGINNGQNGGGGGGFGGINTGGGGGGGGRSTASNTGGAGGSGIIIVAVLTNSVV